MNKYELKSLLENIYTALTEADIPGEWGEDPATGRWRFFPTGSGQRPTPPSATPGGNVRLGPNGLYYPYGIPPVDLDPTNRGPKPFVLPPEVGRLLPRDPVTGEIQGNYAIT